MAGQCWTSTFCRFPSSWNLVVDITRAAQKLCRLMLENLRESSEREMYLRLLSNVKEQGKKIGIILTLFVLDEILKSWEANLNFKLIICLLI